MNNSPYLFVCHVREVENGFVIEVDGANVMQSPTSDGGFYKFKSNDYVAGCVPELGATISELAKNHIEERNKRVPK